MRILVEPSDFELVNLGDMAMMRVAIERLAGLWPHASIEVFSEVPDLLSAFCPEATPIPARCVYGRPQIRNRRTRLADLGEKLRSRRPAFAAYYPVEMLEALSRADLMVVPGMGGLTDAFPEYAFGLLDRMDLALRAGTPVVMVGQGIGPLEDPVLRTRAQEILRRVGFISLREARASYPLLRSLGVPPGRITTTGDDSIETAFSLRSTRLGAGLGINVRAAPYSGVGPQTVGEVGEVVERFVANTGTQLVPIPISRRAGEADLNTIASIAILKSEDRQIVWDADPVTSVIMQITNCRVVVSGSYHAAVFALSVGVPVIALAQSKYYMAKLYGLADQFEVGCTVIPLNDRRWRSMLVRSLESSWDASEYVRPRLLQAAVRQIELSKAAYCHIHELVTSGELIATHKGNLLSNVRSLLFGGDGKYQ